MGSLNGNERTYGRTGINRLGIVERHFDATQTLWVPVRRANKSVERVTTVEVGHPGNSRVVIFRTVWIRATHCGGDETQVHGVRALLGGCLGNTRIDGCRIGLHAVLVQDQCFGLLLTYVDVVVIGGVVLICAYGVEQIKPRGRVNNAGRGKVVHRLEPHDGTTKDHVV